MSEFLDFIRETDHEYCGNVRDEPMIMEQQGSQVRDPVSGQTFDLATIWQDLRQARAEDVGGGIVLFFLGLLVIRIRFAEGGSA